MAVITQALPNLLGGVSQQPPAGRSSNECEEQINGLAFVARGLSKRPATQHSAVLSAVATTAYDAVHTHVVDRSATDRYRVVLSNGDLKVFDAVTGAEQTVVFPNGKTYLNTSDPSATLRAVTIGDHTYITNGTVVVAKSGVKSPDQKHEALVSIRAADFATRYSVTIDSTTLEYTTPDGSDPHTRSEIGTDKIATQISGLITADSSLTAFTVTQYGSTLYIKRTDGAEFAISASDGLADGGILAIKGAVQRFDSLPDRAKNGFIVEITGDPDNKFDNYFVKYNDNGSPNLAGVWDETVKPGILTSLDASTLPLQLSRGSDLLTGIAAGSIAAPPVIQPGATTSLPDVWANYDGVNVITTSAQASLMHDSEECNTSLSELDGTPATVRAWFDISTQAVASGHFVTVELWLSNAPHSAPIVFAGNYTKVASRVYQSGQYMAGESLEALTSLPLYTRVSIRMTYSTGVSPADIFSAYVNLRAASPDLAHIEVVKSVGREVRFDPNGLFPTSCITTLTVGVTPYAHTSTSDETGAQVATALQALVGAPYTAVIIDAGVILVTQSGTGAPTASVAFTFDSTKVFYNATLALIVNQLIGATVRNNSDGSSGTVTANTVTTITVGSLTGGTANKFLKDDICDVIGAVTSYVCGQALWKPRLVGDITTIPFPSIVGKKIGEVFFDDGRLGFAAQGNLVLSQAGDPLNLFRQTVTKLLPNDVIDVQSTIPANFHSATHWNEEVVLWTTDRQFSLKGFPNLTPETVGLQEKTAFINSSRLRPCVAGRRIYFARALGQSTQVHEYSMVYQSFQAGFADATDITKDQPTYIVGSPVQMVVDYPRGIMALLTDADRSKLYVYNFHYSNQALVQNAWSTWQFAPGTHISSIDIIDAKLGLIVSRPQGVYLEIIDLDPAAV